MQIINEMPGRKLGMDKAKMNQTGHSSTGINSNNKSNTRVSKELINSSNNKSYGSSKYMNHSKGSMPNRQFYDGPEEEKFHQ